MLFLFFSTLYYVWSGYREVLYTELVLLGSTLVDFTWLFVFEQNYLEQSEIPFFLFNDIEVAYRYLLGRVFLFDNIFDSFSKVYFLFEFAVFKLLEVE